MKDIPDKSFAVAIEQMAFMLREQIKLSKRSTRVLPAAALPSSIKNSIAQVAQLLRRQIHKSPKRRSWKAVLKRKKK